MNQVGAEIVDVLERAGAQYLKQNDCQLYEAYALHVGATKALRCYDGTEIYWDRVQVILDTFFSCGERAEICGQVIARSELWYRPEFRNFLMHAMAERRLHSLLDATVGPRTAVKARSPAARRAR